MRKGNLVYFGFCLLLTACASVKSPTGGPKDVTPPKLVSSFPMSGSTNFKGKALILEFTEEVSEDNMKLQFLSPLTPITVSSLGKKMKLIADSGWKENTTYVLNLRRKIKDEREGNLLEDTTLSFSTGSGIDSVIVTLKVLEKSGKQGNQKFTALLHKKGKLNFVGTTDSLRPLIVSGLGPAVYNLEVFNDKNENYQYEEEDGNLFTDSLQLDSNLSMTVTPLPQKYKPVKLFKQRKEDTVVIETSAFCIPEGFFKENIIAENEEQTLFWLYPIKESFLFSYSDSLRNCYSDTLLIPKTDSTRSTTPIPIKRKFALEKQGKELSVHLEWNWKISVPPKKMEVTQDSVWKEIPFDCSGNSIRFHSQDFKAGKLKIRYDTLRFFNQNTLRKDSIEISKPDFDPKGSVSGSVKTVSDIPIRVELLNSNKTVVASSTGKNFTWMVKPGKYTLLVFGDIDGDGFYTGGNKETRRKAEPLYMHPEPVELKPGWDLENILLSPGF